jgi:hypothetical protein
MISVYLIVACFSRHISFLYIGDATHPIAPCCMVGFICSDLTTLWCELTSSIRTRTSNDEDAALGIIDRNPAAVSNGSEGDKPEAEKELLLCLRPFHKGEKVEEEL